MTGKYADLLEAIFVYQTGDTLTGGELAGSVLFGDAILAATQFQLGAPGLQVGNTVLH